MSPEQIAADRELWLRRIRDAAIEATQSGATPEQIAEQVADGIREGMRLAEIRRAAYGDEQIAA
jgi:hypothetical protein